jgi:hypothetical protein
MFEKEINQMITQSQSSVGSSSKICTTFLKNADCTALFKKQTHGACGIVTLLLCHCTCVSALLRP